MASSDLYRKLRVDFFSPFELLYPNLKIRRRIFTARPNFYKVSDNPNVCLGFVDCSLYIRHIVLKDDCQKKRMDELAYTPVEYNYMETLAKIFIFLPDKNSSFKKTFSTMLQFVGLLLQ